MLKAVQVDAGCLGSKITHAHSDSLTWKPKNVTRHSVEAFLGALAAAKMVIPTYLAL